MKRVQKLLIVGLAVQLLTSACHRGFPPPKANSDGHSGSVRNGTVPAGFVEHFGNHPLISACGVSNLETVAETEALLTAADDGLRIVQLGRDFATIELGG